MIDKRSPYFDKWGVFLFLQGRKGSLLTKNHSPAFIQNANNGKSKKRLCTGSVHKIRGGY